MNRRKFLSLLGAGAAATLFPKVSRSAPVPDVTGLFVTDPTCLQYMILGYCYCGPYPCGYLVRHWLPVAFVETVKGIGDTLVSPTTTPLTGTRVKENEAQGFEVRIWEIPEILKRLVMPEACMLCSDGYAKANNAGSKTMSQLKKFTEQANVACGGPTTEAVQALIKKAVEKATDGMLKLVYDSELDPVNWRTGCRDLPISHALAFIPVACATGSVLDTINQIGGINLTNPIPGADFCVGKWGSVLPRQYRAQGLTEFVGSGMAAYRALHIAAYTLNTFDYEVSTAGKLQPVFPHPSKCFFPGDSPFTVDLGRLTSPNGNYGYIYWVPVTCCISFLQMATCAIP